MAHVSWKLSAKNVLGHYIRSVPLLDLRVISKCSDFYHWLGEIVGPSEETHLLEYFLSVFSGLELDNRTPHGLVNVSPDLESVVFDVDAGLLNNLMSDLVGSDIKFWKAVEENTVGWLLHFEKAGYNY